MSLLAAVVRGADGRGTACPVLTERLLTHLQLAKVPDLIAWAYGPGSLVASDWSLIASLSRIVHDAAIAGDDVAVSLLGEAADGLASAIGAACAACAPTEITTCVAVGGNLVGHSALLLDLLTARLPPKMQLVRPRRHPAHGAALYGKLVADGRVPTQRVYGAAAAATAAAAAAAS
jgi:N-acetylglucosamine kinase-like BadF-type ATPase